MPYLTCGFPDRDSFVELALGLFDAGADILELGIPFSDPLLDGKTIQASQQVALEARVTPADCLEYARAIREHSDEPLLFMGAYNPLVAYGLDRFGADAAEAGASGVIVPDLPVEEQDELREAAGAHRLHVIQMVAPTSTSDRVARVCAAASGFVYCVSVAGVTGARADFAGTARSLVERVRASTDLPAAVGFGIAGPEQAREVAEYADGVIVGAGLVGLLAQTPAEQRLERASAFVASLRSAVEGPRGA